MPRVVVCGAGITGVLCTIALRDAGHEVVLLERHSPGAGSSSRTAAGIRQQFSTPSTVAGMRHAVAAYRALGERLGQDCITQQGYLFLLDEAAVPEARSHLALQHAAGLVEAEWLDEIALRAAFPAVDTSRCVAATWCPTDGFLHPSVILTEGVRLARSLGADVRTGALVTGARSAGGRITALCVGAEDIGGDVFIDATNAWSPRLAARIEAEPLPVVPTSRYLWFLRRDDPSVLPTMPDWPLIVTPSGVYVRPEHAGSLMMGWSRGDAHDPLAFDDAVQDEVPAHFAGGSDPGQVALEAWAGLAEAIPEAASLDGIAATTTGLYAVTPDHNPFMGYDRARTNLIRLVGFSGHGAMFGPFTAALALALVEAGHDLDALQLPQGRVDLGAFALGRAFGTHEAMVI